MSPDLPPRQDDDTSDHRWTRAASVDLLAAFDAERQRQPIPLRDFEQRQGVPKSTLHEWAQRKAALAADPPLVAFFESPAGLALLHTLLLAAHFVFHALGHAGLRPLAHFFELSGLAPFLANSYGAHQQVADELLDQILAYEAEQRPALAKQMPHRSISVCEDETFPHAGICLVAIEPVSRFVLAEQLKPHRDAATWDTVLTQATTDLNVDLLQQVSDEASALRSHAKNNDIPHSPDLFHILRALNLGTVLALLRQSEAARHAAEDAQAALVRQQHALAAWQVRSRRTGRPPDFASRITAAEASAEQARAWHEKTLRAQHTRQAAIAGISADYHPFDLQTGAPRSPAQVEAALNGHVQRLREMADAQGLGASSRAGIEKGARQTGSMVDTIRFFWSEVDQRVAGAALSETHERLLREVLLPAAYLHQVGSRSSKAETRRSLRAQAGALLAGAKEALGQLHAEAGQRLEALAWECADIFQRSSSCVEGRNGQLALNEHVRRGLSPRRLKALTVLHNYAITGPDGTTAAERFFGQKPADLFTWLCSRMPSPARPALKRPKTKKLTLLEAA
jgi:hypothetical protein